MRMDADLIRTILLMIEADTRREYPDRVLIEGQDQALVDYQIELLNERSFLKGHVVYDDGDPDAGPIYLDNRITMLGHDFLNTIRDGKIWKATKSIASKSGVGTLGAIVQIATTVASQAVSGALGLPPS